MDIAGHPDHRSSPASRIAQCAHTAINTVATIAATTAVNYNITSIPTTTNPSTMPLALKF
jgi:hypothetical protein